MKTKDEMRKLVASGWVAKGEQLKSLRGGVADQGCVGSTIAGVCSVPHVPPEGSVPVEIAHSGTGTPTAVIAEGRFLDGEWVHDPALRAWVQAGSGDALAVQCANNLAAAGADGWYIVTDRRIAVVVESALILGDGLEQLKSAEASEAEEPQEEAGGFAGFLGKARSVAGSVQAGVADRVKFGESKVATLWECSTSQVESGRLVSVGKQIRAIDVGRDVFVDGSVVEVKGTGYWGP